MYVRRELRELLPSNLRALTDAMVIMYEMTTTEGQAVYGKNFVGLDLFQLWHHINAGQRDADHFHQGVGFLAQHAKITYMFELSLQSIDSRLSLPYWDSTIEMAQVETGEIKSVWETTLWSPDLFGTVETDTQGLDSSNIESHLFGSDEAMRSWAIPDGPFAFLKLPEEVNNSFGPGVGSHTTLARLMHAAFTLERIHTRGGANTLTRTCTHLYTLINRTRARAHPSTHPPAHTHTHTHTHIPS